MIEILKGLKSGVEWNVNKVLVATLFAEAKRMWDEDTAKGVKERLGTKAYQYLGTYESLGSRTDTEAILAERSRRGGKRTLASCVKCWKSLKSGRGDDSSFVDADHTCGVQFLVLFKGMGILLLRWL